MSIWRWGLRVAFSVTLVCFTLLSCNTARAENTPVSAEDPCPTSFQDLADKARHANTLTQLTESVLPGGAVTTIEIPEVVPDRSVFCVIFKAPSEVDSPVRVLAALPDKEHKKTKLKLDLVTYNVEFGPATQRELALVSFPHKQDKPDELDLSSPSVAVMQKVKISNGRFAFLGSVAAVVLAYSVIVLVVGRIRGNYRRDPVYLTSDHFDKASLSRLQLLGFTLLVWGLLVFILLRTNVLSDISEHILWLLGISAGGTVGVRVAENIKERLSFENWSWLRNQGWLTAHEEGTYKEGIRVEPDPNCARWGDLLKATDGSLDIYKFQLAVFSLLVGLKLLTSDLATLATFTIPPNLLTLLGLSNGVYIGGKAVAPNSIGELDKKVAELRDAERAWIAKVMAATTAQATPQEKFNAAVQSAPSEYEVYMTSAREAVRMLKSLYGAEGTKFKTEPIDDTELTPPFP